MRVLTPLVCLLLVLIAAASIVHRTKSTSVQHQAAHAAPVPQAAHQHHRIAKSINPKIHTATAAAHNTHGNKAAATAEEDDGSLLASALFDDVKSEKKAVQPTHQKLVHSKKLLRDLEKADVEAELNKVLAAEKDLETVQAGLTSLTSELKGIETAIRAAEEAKVESSKAVVEEASTPASKKATTISPVSTESENNALDAVLAGADPANIKADNKIVTSSNTLEEDKSNDEPVAKTEDDSFANDIPAASAEDNGENENAAESDNASEPVAAAAEASIEAASSASESGDDEHPQQSLETATASSGDDAADNAVDQDQVQDGDSSASFLEISKDDASTKEESLVEQLTRSRMNIHVNKRLAAMRLAETSADKKDDTDDSAIVVTRAGKHVPVDGTGYFKDITKPYVDEVANATAGQNTTDTDVVCVCKRSGAPRGEDRVRCKKHAKPSPSPKPSPIPPVVPVGIRQCATGRWPNGTVPDGGSTDTICIYFPSKIDIITPSPTPTPVDDEPEYPPECYDERNEFVAPGVDKRPYDVLLLQEGFETCGC